MRAFRSVCLYVGAVFLGGALLAPWLYKLTGWAATILPGLEPLAHNPFHRFVNRSLMVLGLVGLWPFLRSAGIRSWRDIGLGKSSVLWSQIGKGFLLGFGTLACVALLALAAGARTVQQDQSATAFWRHLGNAGLAAVFVAILEELLFRGALFGALRKGCPWRLALLGSSGVYALLHFFERPPPPDSVNWVSGLVVLAQMAQGFGDLEKLVPGFLNLSLAGCILGLGYQFTGTLYFSIGLHAGWIFWLKSYGFLTRESANPHAWFWGSGKLIDGWSAFAMLSLVILILWRKGSAMTACNFAAKDDSTP